MMREKRFKGNAERYQETFSRFEAGLNGESSSAVHRIRKNALQQFSAEGYPTTRDEEWKYTNIRPLSNIDFVPAEKPDLSRVDERLLEKFKFEGLDTLRYTFINGHFVPELSHKDAPQNGIRLLSIRAALETGDPDIEKFLNHYAGENGDSFTMLNTAFLWDGLFVYVPDNTILEKPVSILYFGFSGEQPLLNMPRSLIVMGRNSEARIVEVYAGQGETPYFTNTVSEIVLAENAGLDHIRLQSEAPTAFHISTTHVDQRKNSRYDSHAFSFGGHLVRNNLNLGLNDQGISSILNGLYVGTGDQHIDNHTSIDHAKPNCYSEELYKGVLDDKAHGVFNGKIFVRPDAQKTNAIQSNNCILLSDNAAIDTKPQLEIFADAVRCTHGATVGQLDEDAYFYMRSRGIDRVRARQLLIFAFASAVIDRIESEPIREQLSAILAEKLHTIKP